VLVYWAAITLGPFLLGASLSITSYAISASKGVIGGLPGGVGFILNLIQFLLVAGGMTLMFRYVPNTHVRWGHAWMGGLFVSAGMEIAKKILGWYLVKVPTYSLVYGAFATVPILLVWIYVAWVIVLLGAALTAHLPNLLAGGYSVRAGPGWQFNLAMEVLRVLDADRRQPHKGSSAAQLCKHLRVDAQRLEVVLETLVELDWVALLEEGNGADEGARFVLLANPDTTPLTPLMQQLLLPPAQVKNLYEIGHWPSISLRDAL
jgi:membrane protein